MKKYKTQLNMLMVELSKRQISAERVLVIKEKTKEIALRIDEELGVHTAYGMVSELYNSDTRYIKRRVKRVVNMLIGYCEESK